VGISRVWRDFQGGCGAVFSTISFRSHRCEQVRAPADRQASIQVFTDRDRTAGQSVSEASFVQLQTAVLDDHGVVLAHHTFGLHREHKVQIFAAALAKGSPFLGGRLSTLSIELGDVAVAEECVGLLEASDGGEP
jgi:hypothetical protein